jgi:hypothetical protein
VSEAVGEEETPMLKTVNVIEYSEGEILGLASYPDTKEGNTDAEARFKDLIGENTGIRTEEDVAAALDDGYVEDGTYKVVIFHSTVNS